MSKEVIEKSEATKKALIEMPASVHARVVRHQRRLIGRRELNVTFADACVDLLEKATKSIK